ncbi:hypothetical protein Rhopal_001835-T1 [Rhodotorula paludigena]|nr:hypothetical protein Rhopal_001835-T1 [Rhodotorula paludigena]
MTMCPEEHGVLPDRYQLSTPFASNGALTADDRFTLPAISSTPSSPPSAAAYEHWKAAFDDPLGAASSGVYINDLPAEWPAIPTISFPRFHRDPALFAPRELLTTPVLFAGTGPTLFAMHTEEAGIAAVNTLIAGAPKVWWVLRPSDTLKFEELVRSTLRHMRLWPHLDDFATINARPLLVAQYPGDTVILDGSAGHYGANSGPNLAWSIGLRGVGPTNEGCRCLEAYEHATSASMLYPELA